MRSGRIALSLALVVALGGAALWVVPRGLDAARLMAAADDPATLADLRLAKSFDAATATREIDAALAANDPELARSFLDLAADRGVNVDPSVKLRVEAAEQAAASLGHKATSFVRGFVTGVPQDGASLAGTAAGDLSVFGDVRDAVREGVHALRGEKADPWMLGLAGVGIAITAGTYATVGLAAPARAGLSLLKVARRSERIGAPLVRALRAEKATELVRFAGDVGRIEARAGSRAALDGLKAAEHPRDLTRLASLAAAKGGKTRAIVKLFGRGALMLTTGLFDLGSWVFWAVANLIALCAAVKRTTERMTQRYLDRRKLRRARLQAHLRQSHLAAVAV
ncbi:MAG TPA: hypothetical protein VHA77_04245 [Xanthobacteraceae bacterium]|nr:hypothetical protein [Xanthobacteraceae bacterium]